MVRPGTHCEGQAPAGQISHPTVRPDPSEGKVFVNSTGFGIDQTLVELGRDVSLGALLWKKLEGSRENLPKTVRAIPKAYCDKVGAVKERPLRQVECKTRSPPDLCC